MTSEFHKIYSKTNSLIVEDLKNNQICENDAMELSDLILFRFIFLICLERLNIKKPHNILNGHDLNEEFKKAHAITGDFTSLFEKDIETLPEDDEIFKNLNRISASDIDFNIFAILFERILKDSKTVRKNDGVFYTPDYITDYISKNTIIPYLSKSGKATTVCELIGEYDDDRILKEKLKNIRILDPSCGSGAFLIKSCEVLYEIYSELYGDADANMILNNLYGVDLNEKSIEITKISLFLKLMQYGCDFDAKILNRNIICGDSLIEDEEISDNAFKWEAKFEG